MTVDLDDRAQARACAARSKAASSSACSRVAGQHRAAGAVQPDDVRRPLERAEHHHDAAVVAQVGDASPRRCRRSRDRPPAAGRAPRTCRVIPFGERLTWPPDPLGRGGHEEHRLRLDERAQPPVDRLVDLRHAADPAHRRPRPPQRGFPGQPGRPPPAPRTGARRRSASGCHCTPNDEPARRVLDRLDHVVVGPAGHGQLARVGHRLVVVRVDLGRLAEHRRGDAAGREPGRVRAVHARRRLVPLVAEQRRAGAGAALPP